MCETAGEDEQDYVVRVGKLSRDADLGTTDVATRRLCLVLATNSLRDVNFQRKLMAGCMNWAEFTRILNPEQWQARQRKSLKDTLKTQCLSKRKWV